MTETSLIKTPTPERWEQLRIAALRSALDMHTANSHGSNGTLLRSVDESSVIHSADIFLDWLIRKP